MKSEDVKKYFEDANVVSDYSFAVTRVGLWASERIVFEKYIKKDAQILELGCGAGRISINLYKEGYENISASDYSLGMIDSAKIIAQALNCPAPFIVEDARDLSNRKKNFYDAVIFGFNGFMQIPQEENRRKVIEQVNQVLKEKGVFIFTSHDRRVKQNTKFWQDEKSRWESSNQEVYLDDFGDKFYQDERGFVFMHSPIEEEVISLLKKSAFSLLYTKFRSSIALENDYVREFSDDCRFWVFEKGNV